MSTRARRRMRRAAAGSPIPRALIRDGGGGTILPMRITDTLGMDLPIIQAPMAGVQGSALAIAVCEAGGLGSLPCAMLSRDSMRGELTAIRSHTGRPFNVNLFCHSRPVAAPTREAAWRAQLA